MAEGDSKGNLEDDSEDDLHSELRGEQSTKHRSYTLIQSHHKTLNQIWGLQICDQIVLD